MHAECGCLSGLHCLLVRNVLHPLRKADWATQAASLQMELEVMVTKLADSKTYYRAMDARDAERTPRTLEGARRDSLHAIQQVPASALVAATDSDTAEDAARETWVDTEDDSPGDHELEGEDRADMEGNAAETHDFQKELFALHPPARPEVPRAPANRDIRFCGVQHATGHCPRGASCPYSHDPKLMAEWATVCAARCRREAGLSNSH